MQDMADLWRGNTHLCPKPIDTGFYIGLSERLGEAKLRETTVLSGFDGLAVDLRAGELLRLTTLEGPQIVNLFAYNHNDVDERYWAQHTVTTEGLFLTRYSRLWGTMARHRPLLTIIEDTVTPPRRVGSVEGRHHPCFSGFGIPIVWRAAGGTTSGKTPWEQFARLMESKGLSSRLLKDDVSVFQKMRIDGYSQHLDLMPSDALAGDRVTFFAEIDLTVLLALSPFIDGWVQAREASKMSPRSVETAVMERVAEPLGWPYPGVPYPDLSLYLDETSARSDKAVPTAGRE